MQNDLLIVPYDQQHQHNHRQYRSMFRLPEHVVIEGLAAAAPGRTEEQQALIAGEKKEDEDLHQLKHPTRQNIVYKCSCGAIAISILFLCIVLIYWITAFSITLSNAVSTLHNSRPTFFLNTVDNVASMLSSTSEVTKNLQSITIASKQALDNITASSTALLSNIEHLTREPDIHLKIG